MLPVILLGGLNIVRALGLAGIPVVIATQDRRAPSTASRYCKGVVDLPPLAERDAVVETLVAAATKHGARLPLFYDNDDRLALVQDCRATLAPYFTFLLNEPALADALLEKSRFQALAERTGLPVPRRIEWQDVAAEAGPVLVKPKTRTAWDNSSVRLQLFGGAGKARVFAHGRAARADALVAQLADKLQFQEYVPGGDDTIWSFHGFAAPSGEVLASFVGRKIRTYPALTGDSSYLRLARDESLEALGRDIAARLGLAGIFKMDFKRSSESGRFTLLEINTRFNLWHYLGAMNGVNLPEIAYHYLTEKKIPQKTSFSVRYRWLCLREDWRALREGQVSLPRWLLSLAYMPKVYDIFAWSDPLPVVRYWTAKVRSALSRRIPRWLVPAS
ncbi:MAG: D-aspartate ligase [Betaproteobacteria bacterium]|jgi:predicted ATP-grasp superfamily ATP-dependent carboligase|nr:D-aspartate ligase [Betaproteobacteria bacterium]